MSLRQLFEAFAYGAALFHKIPGVDHEGRKKFVEVFDKTPRHELLFALNASLKQLMRHVSNAAVVIYRDYSHWLTDYKLPPPDTRWHNKLFDIDSSKIRGT